MRRQLIPLLILAGLLGAPQAALAEEPYFSKELGLKLKLVRANYLYHAKSVFFPALQITEIAATSILNDATVIPATNIDNTVSVMGGVQAKGELLKRGVLPARIDDLLILHDFIEMDAIAVQNAERLGKTYPDTISGRHLVQGSLFRVSMPREVFDRTVAQLPIFSVDSPRDYLRLSLAMSSRYRHKEELPFFRFRIARPIAWGSPYHASTAVRFTEPDGSNDNLQGPAVFLPSPPDRRERTSQPVFETPNPFCSLQFQQVFKEQPGDRCRIASRNLAAPGFPPAQSISPVALGFWTAVVAGTLLGGGGKQANVDFQEGGRTCRYRVGRHVEPNYLGTLGYDHDYLYKVCD